MSLHGSLNIPATDDSCTYVLMFSSHIPAVMGSLLSDLGLSASECLPLALKALDHDSQGGVLGERGSDFKLSEQVWQTLERAMAQERPREEQMKEWEGLQES